MEPFAARIAGTPPHLTLLPMSRRHVRRASDLVGYVIDEEALQALIIAGDPVVYEIYEPEVPDAEGHLVFGLTVLYPGRIGPEYHLTKGHFHIRRATAEVYHCLHGTGYLVMQDGEGSFRAVALLPGAVAYVPPGWAHRSVNTGEEPLVLLYVYPGGAGHDYETVRRQGFSHVVVEVDGRAEVLPRDAVRRRVKGG